MTHVHQENDTSIHSLGSFKNWLATFFPAYERTGDNGVEASLVIVFSNSSVCVSDVVDFGIHDCR
jgi:hypothetical protein